MPGKFNVNSCIGPNCSRSEKVKKILATKSGMKKMNKKPSPTNPPTTKTKPQPEEKMLLSVTNHSAGEPDEKEYDGNDTQKARAAANKKNPGSAQYVK